MFVDSQAGTAERGEGGEYVETGEEADEGEEGEACVGVRHDDGDGPAVWVHLLTALQTLGVVGRQLPRALSITLVCFFSPSVKILLKPDRQFANQYNAIR